MPYSPQPTAYASRGREPESLVTATFDKQGCDTQGPDGADGAGDAWEGYSADILAAVLDG